MRHIYFLLLIPLYLVSCKKETPTYPPVVRNTQLQVTVKKVYAVTPTLIDSSIHNALVSIYQTADDRTYNSNAEQAGYTNTSGVALFSNLKKSYYYIAASYGGKTVYNELSTPDNSLSYDEIDF